MKKFALQGFFICALSIAWGTHALAAIITVNKSINWSALGIAPTSADTVVVQRGATLTVDVANGQCASIQLGLDSGAAGQQGNGTLVFNAGSQVTVSGSVIVGDNASGGARTGSIDMSAGGTLILQGFTVNVLGTWTPGTGTVQLTANNTLPGVAGFNTFNKLTINGGTTTLGQNTTVNSDLTVTAGTLNTSAFTLGVAGNFVVNGTVAGTGAVTLSGSGTNIDGTGSVTNTATLTISTGAKSILSTANLSFAGTIAVSGAITVTNNGTITSTAAGGVTGSAVGSTWTNAANSTLNVAGPLLATGTLNASAGGNTVNYNGGGAQTIKTPSGNNYFNLSLSTGGVKTLPAGTLNILGNLSVASGVTYNGTTNNPTVNLAGNLTDSGTFNSGTGTFTFNGSAAQTLTGATTFSKLTMANTAAAANQKLTINNDVTVSTQLTFTTGRIVTAGTTKVIIPSGGAVSGAGSGTGFVAGKLQRFVAAGSSTVTFDVGTDGASAPALAYSPVSLSFTGVGAGGGNLIAQATTGDDPNLSDPSSGLNGAKSVNRWWSLTTSGVTGTALPAFTNFSATFTFVAGDVDVGANTANFETERWDGTAWNTTTVGTRTATTTQATGITALGDFEVAEKKVVVVIPTSFNAFETITAAGAITGKIFTKVAGTAFSLDVVAILSGAQASGFTGNVKLELLANTGTPGVGYGADNCPTSNIVIQTIASATITAGRSTVSFSTVANAYRDVRVRISYPTVSPTVTSCSTDSFAVRPASITISATDTDAQTAGTVRALNNTGATGGNVHKAGTPFTLSAQAFLADGTTTATNYDGTPTLVTGNPSCVAPPASCATGTLALGAWSGAGTRASNTASYTEAGVFTLQLEDQSYASVDSGDGSSLATRTVPSTASITVGRFIPDHFTVLTSAIANRVVLGCGGSFSYMGEGVGLSMTLEAHQSPSGITTNYKGTLAKLDPTTPASFAFGAKSGSTNLTSRVTAVSTSGSWSSGSAAVTGTLSIDRLSSGNPDGPYTAVQFGIAPVDSDGVAMGTLDLDVDGDSVNDHKSVGATTEVRFGRLRVLNSVGSEKLDLPMPMYAEYFSGGGFVKNTSDSCTSIATGDISLGNYTPAAFSGNMNATHITVGGAFASGVGSITLTKPSPAASGSVDVTVNLGAAGKSYLQGRWTSSTYTDPIARASFGTFGTGVPGQFIFFRENF